jgi:two-component system sensor histidine kinase KdpD
VFLAASLAAALAHQGQRPVTAAIVYLFGVVLVAALEGVRGGLLAALLASVTYNLLLTDPFLRPSLSSAEDLVPVIAFNLSAAVSGLVAGRLRDRARAAEVASRRMRGLFEASRDLQSAMRVEDVLPAAAAFAGSEAELYTLAGTDLAPVAGSRFRDLAERLVREGRETIGEGAATAFALTTPAGPLGALVVGRASEEAPERHAEDLETFVSVVSITVERCLLLERMSEAELVERSERFKTALLSSVSHDMRTPLSAISASVTSLLRFGGELREDTRLDLLKMIEEQCARLDRYTTNLLNLSRLQAGLDSEHFVVCDAIEVLGSAILRIRALQSGHGIEKRFELLAAPVLADPVMLEQVFYNVLENAVRYSPAGSPITVSAGIAGGSVEIVVGDRGRGIDPAEISHIFDRFYRGGTVQGEGSGLGLSIAKGFAEAFGGSIEASSREEEGTMVAIRLPRGEDRP